MSSVSVIEYNGYQIRLVEKGPGNFWFVAADVCRCVELAINSRTGKPNVTVATRELLEHQKEKYRVDMPDNPKNPWIDMMIVSESGLMQMLAASDDIKAQDFRQYLQGNYPEMGAGIGSVYAQAK